MADLLFEIGLEEVPARMIAGAEAELLRRTVALLGRERLLPEGFDELAGAKSYSTPRRLAVLVRGVRERQEDVSEEVTGPAVKIAFKDGVATPAAEAFARKNGIAVADLKTVTTPKGEYIAATSVKAGRSAAEVIAAELPKEVGAIYWAKNMYWRAGKPERFVRPVLWLVCLLGEKVVPVSFGGKTAGRATFGHRVLSSGEAFEIESPESYEAQLAGEYVLVDVEARRYKIRKALDHATREVAGARWREDEALVDQVTHLTEWPTVLLGNFEPEYLALPEEVLVTVMRDHQKYFAVEDAEGKLAPHFLTVLNISTDENSAAIIRQGNERVLRARFNDARFFWEFDRRISLYDREELLKRVTFQKEIGTFWEKSQHVLHIVRHLCATCAIKGQPLETFAQNQAELSARLAKTDLTTELVKEFTDLEGRIGGRYALDAGFSEILFENLYWQYEPRNSSSPIPPTAGSQILALADRMNTIVDMIAIGNLPTGSKDPYALRRSANGVVKILAEGQLPLGLSDIYEAARIESKFAKTDATRMQCEQFLRERLEFYLRENRGHAYDVVKAVLAVGADDVRDAVARAQAVSIVRGKEDFAAVSAAFKRMKNILEQAESKGLLGERIDISQTGHPIHQAHTQLQMAASGIKERVDHSFRTRDYVSALELIATLRPPIDRFFEEVMVMDPNPAIREHRLSLLQNLLGGFSAIADFSEIVTAG